jgi:hypothetical protein
VGFVHGIPGDVTTRYWANTDCIPAPQVVSVASSVSIVPIVPIASIV